jgi:GxxExxY protein
MELGEEDDELIERVIGCAIEVHRHLGPGLLEGIYEDCLCLELTQLGIAHQRQVLLPIVYKGVQLEAAYRLDLVVENRLVVEIKAIDRILTVHEAQLLTYLRISGHRTGLILNFNHAVLKEGIRRMTR